MRTKEEINQEYSKVCGQYGDLEFRIIRMKEDLENLVKRLRELEKEYSEVTRKPVEDLEYPQNPEDTKTP